MDTVDHVGGSRLWVRLCCAGTAALALTALTLFVVAGAPRPAAAAPVAQTARTGQDASAWPAHRTAPPDRTTPANSTSEPPAPHVIVAGIGG
ncbi:MAG TPA: hypothetical protein VIV12_25275, partial [Streptosporangiaceae bacterium]